MYADESMARAFALADLAVPIPAAAGIIPWAVEGPDDGDPAQVEFWVEGEEMYTDGSGFPVFAECRDDGYLVCWPGGEAAGLRPDQAVALVAGYLLG